MADPVSTSALLGGAAIGAAGSLLGGAIAGSGSKEAQKIANEFNVWQLMKNEELQREFAQHGVRWRVEDAKAAGLHPLYALGAQTSGFSPVTVMAPEDRSAEFKGRAVAEAGQSLGRAVAAQESPEQTLVRLAQLRLMESEAEKNFALASGLRSEAVRASVTGRPDLGDPEGYVRGDASFTRQGTLEGGGIDPQRDRATYKPREITSRSSSDPSLTAFSSPGWDMHTIAKDGFSMLLPAGNSMQEALESMSESKVILGWVIARNVEEWGQRWMVRFMKQYGSLFY